MGAAVDLVLVAVGLGVIVLGLWHLGVPIWFQVGRALDGERRGPLPPVRMAPVRYGTMARDVLGITWIMNLAASYGLITIGIAMLAAPLWMGTPAGRVLALWMAGWWLVRAGGQLAMGRRRIDLVVMTAFAALGVLGLAIAVA
jgi:hypothetical protein